MDRSHVDKRLPGECPNRLGFFGCCTAPAIEASSRPHAGRLPLRIDVGSVHPPQHPHTPARLFSLVRRSRFTDSSMAATTPKFRALFWHDRELDVYSKCTRQL